MKFVHSLSQQAFSFTSFPPQVLKGLMLPTLSLFWKIVFQPGFSNNLYFCFLKTPVPSYNCSKTKFHLPKITDFSLWMCLLILVSASISLDYLCFTFSLFVFFIFSWLCMPLHSKWLKSNLLVWQTSCIDRTLPQYFVNLSLFLSTHVVVINITVGIAEMRTVLFSLFLSWDAIKWSNDTRHTVLGSLSISQIAFCICLSK